MESKAKLIDLIQNVPLYDNLMISRKCYSVVESLNLPEHQIFPLKFLFNGNLNEDYLTFSIVKKHTYLRYISWKHSRFYKTLNFHQKVIDELQFSAYDEMMKHKMKLNEEGYGLKPALKLNYNNDYDIISFGIFPMPIGYWCSERTMNRIIEYGLVGFEFEPISCDLFVTS